MFIGGIHVCVSVVNSLWMSGSRQGYLRLIGSDLDSALVLDDTLTFGLPPSSSVSQLGLRIGGWKPTSSRR